MRIVQAVLNCPPSLRDFKVADDQPLSGSQSSRSMMDERSDMNGPEVATHLKLASGEGQSHHVPPEVLLVGRGQLSTANMSCTGVD